jgi:uncharacterized damage-inducible protein DinB
VLTAKYYARLRELLPAVPNGRLAAKVAAEGLTVADTIMHVCQSDLWYLHLIDGVSRELPDAPADVDSLLGLLQQTEETVTGFLEALDPEMLVDLREVPAWWAEGARRSVRLILMHSLAHKYYHCGQLQSILHILAAED